MTKKKTLLFGGGALALLAAGAAGLAFAPGPRGLAAADLDGNGQITAAESATAAQKKFTDADVNKDGKLTADELPRRGRGDHGGRHRNGPPPVAAAQAQPQSGQVAQRQKLDADGDGAVTAAEFADRFQRRFARADANHDGIVSVAELAAAKPQRGGHHRR